MQIVKSIEDLQRQVADIRTLRLGFVTNFYLDPVKHSIWIEKGDCFTERVADTLFVIKQSLSFWNVFYCSTSIDALGNDMELFLTRYSDRIMMYDLVGRDIQTKPLVDLFKARGCREASSLVRMTRMTEPIDYFPDATIRPATEKDLPWVSRQLHQYFDERVEQIPYDEELMDFIRHGCILICEEDSNKAGFLVYESNATTLYLRYWFTNPDYRDKKVGSRLLRRFLEVGKATKRQMLWVIRTNETAKVRYQHYGFAEENMYDYVMEYNSDQETNITMEEQIIRILTELRPEFDFTQKDIDFIEEGMLDSFDLVTLVSELDNYYGISIDGLDILPENFCSVDAITKLLIKNGAK